MTDKLPIDSMITFLYTRDLEATIGFYEGALGLKVVVDQGDMQSLADHGNRLPRMLST